MLFMMRLNGFYHFLAKMTAKSYFVSWFIISLLSKPNFATSRATSQLSVKWKGWIVKSNCSFLHRVSAALHSSLTRHLVCFLTPKSPTSQKGGNDPIINAAISSYQRPMTTRDDPVASDFTSTCLCRIVLSFKHSETTTWSSGSDIDVLHHVISVTASLLIIRFPEIIGVFGGEREMLPLPNDTINESSVLRTVCVSVWGQNWKIMKRRRRRQSSTIQILWMEKKKKNTVVPWKLWPRQSRGSSCDPAPHLSVEAQRDTARRTRPLKTPPISQPPTGQTLLARCISLSDFIASLQTLLLLLQDGIITIKHISSSSIISRLLKIIAS